MLTSQLISPNSIAVVGASENRSKPGGKVLQNLIDAKYQGTVYAVNKKPLNIVGTVYVSQISEIPSVDLAIIAIPAHQCIDAVKQLIEKGARAFIIFSAGFSEAGAEGKSLEKKLVEIINNANATMIGPNCIGIINENYKGVFTTPVPEYDSSGCELISSSGATAVFIMESALLTGLKFSNIYSIGNASQTGVEDILEYMDTHYIPGKSPAVKLLYLEEIKNPFKFIKHVTSLRKKGCRIAAIKSGYSEAGGRAASSHTGALATSDTVIRALFSKCGIVYCSSRDELIAVASVFQTKELKGKNIAIITHAGGSAVMLTDALTSNGMNVPNIPAAFTKELLSKLNAGSSVANPIDFLATGTAEQLGVIIDFCENYDAIDGMVVVFGSPGLFNVKDVYEILDKKISTCSKPVFPVLPSLINAEKEIKLFLSKGRVNFPDEVNLGKALAHVFNSELVLFEKAMLPEMDFAAIRSIINSSYDGFLNPDVCRELLDAARISMAKQKIITDIRQLTKTEQVSYPLVMKVIGPVHKTEVGGVILNIINEQQAVEAFTQLMRISGAKSVLVQEMIQGEELYCGAVKQGDFGHVVLCGLGGIFLELLNDTSSALAPMSRQEVITMVESLKGYKLIEGYRNRNGLNKEMFIDIIMRVGALVHIAPEITELDLNPIIANEMQAVAVDVRIRIEK
ncbi:MAG: Protein lysine acetyltransferase Pat [Bacteroidia bacterium]|nr:Protein lysine acetyltransferase Pat [Bacteroidia bacterium]MBX3106995.1 acetate--CoA ligase family protein [Bacteroidota bacterium]MCE7955150.1 CoA-binding protein [Bacteroidetes bacterium CHB6]